jgi:hypothetical protein
MIGSCVTFPACLSEAYHIGLTSWSARKMHILFMRWLRQMVALLTVWGIILAASGLIDELCGTVSHFIILGWLGVGIAVMLVKRVNFPFPRVDQIDIPGAFRMLWWAAFWPHYLGWFKK